MPPAPFSFSAVAEFERRCRACATPCPCTAPPSAARCGASIPQRMTALEPPYNDSPPGKWPASTGPGVCNPRSATQILAAAAIPVGCYISARCASRDAIGGSPQGGPSRTAATGQSGTFSPRTGSRDITGAEPGTFLARDPPLHQHRKGRSRNGGVGACRSGSFDLRGVRSSGAPPRPVPFAYLHAQGTS